ncbi:nucleolar protein 8 [Otolemur garnettii]|uniref:nucleolar protein 8 n=1 Tax=Otolemur garnettii TaxID=30611 RepID=UPI00064409DF|nr:nucleolar protein 8 [Otolemur garnettii]
MKANREPKRLFVGGLSETVSETDLQNQFSRFGEVSDVEIITRKDDQGNPQKIFAYINIKVAEADLKKCMSVLNKTKWKGGTLQIQLAKESFLHRLAQEREEAKAKKEKLTSSTNLLEKMGGANFHMKAVPGTEVPGHKNWVVSKFGRVLPVLHLKNQHKRKIVKYDPSKYCHNLKKIGEDFTNTIPISSLNNQKRLAALEARQKAKEVQKKLVHNALANLDGHPEDKPTHIIFGSDSENETEEIPTKEQSHDSSENEESDSEDDSNRFKIKPQFEGRAGQKLMDLQSHFGTDERFRMDSRFLESDSEEEQEEVNEKKTAEEEELAEEKKKALNVIQSVLHMNLSSSTSKGSVPAKKFKDIIRYDPTRHDHATYERKRDDQTKESKAKRKKKREEAEKVPEVSKEIYYNIATDLKEIFQAAKDTSEKEDTPGNEDCVGEKSEEIKDSATLTSGAEQPGSFTFSFFGSDTKDMKEEIYRVETMKPGKITWQEDPRFQDSSSEEEDITEETDHRKPSPEEESLPEKETTRFFFFSENDERLHGSDLFWRGVGSNISKSSWEARTNNLRMDCRKKHKDAKRKMKPK